MTLFDLVKLQSFFSCSLLLRSNQFLACNIGYHGQQCESQCPYPLYGNHCQMVCMCKENDCHYAHGCYNTNQGTLHLISDV